MVTFQQAREAVAARAAQLFPQGKGTLYVSRVGGEDATHYEVPTGAKEYVVGGDHAYAILDWPVFLVDKKTGEVTEHQWMEVGGRVDDMEAVSA